MEKLKLTSFTNENCSTDDYNSFIVRGGRGINNPIYNHNTHSDVFTYIFSKRLSLDDNISYMNINFKKLIQMCAGSLYWTDKETKYMWMRFHNELGDNIVWQTIMKHVEPEKSIFRPRVEKLRALMYKIEEYYQKERNVANAKIVFTFENRFLLPHSYKIINTDYGLISDVSELPCYNFPYNNVLM
jgi:hypothetical protein